MISRHQDLAKAFGTFYAQKPVLITGGAGFIGSFLTESLVTLNAQVTVLDDLSTGCIHNLKSCIQNVTCIQASACDLTACMKAATKQSIIFHLAAQTSIQSSIRNPQTCFSNNILATQNMLEAARIHGAQAFIFASSAAVYGTIEEKLHEEMACQPISPYGHSKLIGELLCTQYHQSYNLHTTALRLFNVTASRSQAERMQDSMPARIHSAMQTGKTLTIFGDGSQTRDFIPIDDVIIAFLAAGMTDTQFAGSTINVATGSSCSIIQHVQHLKNQYPDTEPSYTFKPARTGDILHSQADIHKLQKLYTSITHNQV